MAGLRVKANRLQMLKRAAGAKVGIVWKTGLLPSASHGASVDGVTDAGLHQLRPTAGMVVGARPAASLTLPLVMGMERQLRSHLRSYSEHRAHVCQLHMGETCAVEQAAASLAQSQGAHQQQTIMGHGTRPAAVDVAEPLAHPVGHGQRPHIGHGPRVQDLSSPVLSS